MVIVIPMDQIQSYEFEPMVEFVPCIYFAKQNGEITNTMPQGEFLIIQFERNFLKD